MTANHIGGPPCLSCHRWKEPNGDVSKATTSRFLPSCQENALRVRFPVSNSMDHATLAGINAAAVRAENVARCRREEANEPRFHVLDHFPLSSFAPRGFFTPLIRCIETLK